MSNKRVQNGRSIDHVLAADVSSGDPILVGNMVVIASVDGLTGETIACRTTEVHNIAKADAATFTQGDAVNFDTSAGEVISAGGASGDLDGFGIAWETKGATTGEELAVLLTPGTGTPVP